MKQEIKINGAFKNIINGKEIKMLTDNYKSNVFFLNPRREIYDKPIIWEITNSSGSVITKYLTYDEFKEKFKENTFIILNE